MKLFSFLAEPLAELDGSSAARLVAAATDVSLVVDAAGIVVDLAFGSEDLLEEVADRWQGRAWSETVTPESRPKVEEMLEAVRAGAAPATLQVSHVVSDFAELPVRYRVVPLDEGRVIALGQDLRGIAALQQQLLNAQQSLERDYWQLRQVETRYRLLFQMATEAVVIVDAASGKVLEANPAAADLLAAAGRSIIGRPFPAGLDEQSMAAVQAMLAEARAVGRASTEDVRIAGREERLVASANLIRQDTAARFLVRLSPRQGEDGRARGGDEGLEAALAHGPDAVLVTDEEARVLAANPAFLDLAQVASPEQARGASLERWLGRAGVDMNVMLGSLRQHGQVRLFPTTLRGEYDTVTDVEISAAAFTSGEHPRFVIFIRNVGRRVSAEAPMRERLPRSVEQLTERVGRVPLKELVGESTDLIERLCIEEALRMTGGNRASAAELLGLSRQSLYAKLRRYELNVPGGTDEES